MLDIVLSRRTKAWRYFLRISYRFSRANIKLVIFWFMWLLTTELASGIMSDQLVAIVRRLAQTNNGRRMHRAWVIMQTYPVLSTLSFSLYSLVAGWVLRLWLKPRAAGTGHQGGRDRSGLTWLISFIFCPTSLGRSQNPADSDFELDENMEALFERLALPNIWLTPMVPVDYLKYLPIWGFSGWQDHCDSCTTDVVDPSMQEPSSACRHSAAPDLRSLPPSGMIAAYECAICLERYACCVHVCGLPCGHHFHRDCIMIWLQRDNHHCPICRWPAYRSKCISPVSGIDGDGRPFLRSELATVLL